MNFENNTRYLIGENKENNDHFPIFSIRDNYLYLDDKKIDIDTISAFSFSASGDGKPLGTLKLEILVMSPFHPF